MVGWWGGFNISALRKGVHAFRETHQLNCNIVIMGRLFDYLIIIVLFFVLFCLILVVGAPAWPTLSEDTGSNKHNSKPVWLALMDFTLAQFLSSSFSPSFFFIFSREMRKKEIGKMFWLFLRVKGH